MARVSSPIFGWSRSHARRSNAYLRYAVGRLIARMSPKGKERFLEFCVFGMAASSLTTPSTTMMTTTMMAPTLKTTTLSVGAQPPPHRRCPRWSSSWSHPGAQAGGGRRPPLRLLRRLDDLLSATSGMSIAEPLGHQLWHSRQGCELLHIAPHSSPMCQWPGALRGLNHTPSSPCS